MEGYSKEIERSVSRITEMPSTVAISANRIALISRVCLSVDPKAAELLTWEAWTTWMQVAEASFAMCSIAPGETVERIINQKTRTLHHLPADFWCDAGTWMTAFSLAVTCRDTKRIKSLCQISPEFLKEASEKEGGAYDDYIYPWISAVQDFILGRPSLGDNLYQAMEMSKPENSSISSSKGLNHLVFPAINSLYRLAERKTEKFNESMEQGIRLFRKYYTEDEELSKSARGTVPLHLMAIACMAYDLAEMDTDFTPDLESGYLPKHILKRSRHGDLEI
ncbi:immunity 49 family protein [Nocardiopsis algeriensis]|uniref:immunity 49 family protein n=1 Tax=Nocardiopsis algeriensis TaxID=1478215 RepID=UPI003B427BFB